MLQNTSDHNAAQLTDIQEQSSISRSATDLPHAVGMGVVT